MAYNDYNYSLDKVKLIDNYIYFYHLDEFCIIPVYPESLTDQMQSTFRESNALSRSAPVLSYSNSGPRTVNINFDLHRDLMNDVNKDISTFKIGKLAGKDKNNNYLKDDYIDTLIKYLQAASVPVYKPSDTRVDPPRVAVRIGKTVFINGIINGSINVTYAKPIMSDNKYAKVNISFTVTEVDPYDANAIKSVGSFRGVCACNNISGKEADVFTPSAVVENMSQIQAVNTKKSIGGGGGGGIKTQALRKIE